MPAQSQQQQKLFGLALAFKRGEVPASEVSDEIKDIADRMSEKEIEDFASTKHKGLPKMKEQLRKIVREIMREQSISEMELSKADMEKLHSDGEVDVDGETVTYDESVNEAKIYKAIFAVKKEKDAKDFFTMVDRSPKIKAMTRDSGVFKVGNELTIRFGVGSKDELELIKKVAKLEGLKIVKIDESVNEISIPQLAKKDAEHLNHYVGGKSEKEVRQFIDRVYKFYPKNVRKYMADAFMDYNKGNRTLKYLTTVLRVMHQDIRESVN